MSYPVSEGTTPVAPEALEPAELFDVIVEALTSLNPDPETPTGKRMYLAYLAARLGQGAGDVLARRFVELRGELGI